MKPIETRWKGYRFRSRLEARWAVFFDTLGLHWEYGPEGFELVGAGRYLPDFKVRYPGRWPDEAHDQWFEVKASLDAITKAEWRKMFCFVAQTGQNLMVLDGTPALIMYASAADLCLAEATQPNELDERMAIVPPGPSDLAKYTRLDRPGFALWCGKGRLWWDDGWSEFTGGGEEQLAAAVDAARSARFEFESAAPSTLQ